MVQLIFFNERANHARVSLRGKEVKAFKLHE